MDTIFGAQLLSDLSLARIRGLESPAHLSALRGARTFIYRATALVVSAFAYQGRFVLTLATGFNNNDDPHYIQFFDQATLPAMGDVPIQTLPVNPQQEGSWSPSQDGLIFEHACVFGLSSTAATFTAAPAGLYMRIEGLVL
jgi:hypothetical protein